MSKHQGKINWAAVLMAVAGVLTAVTETLRSRAKDKAHSVVTTTQDLEIAHLYDKLSTLEERLIDREDGAKERWRTLSDMRVQMEHVLTTLDHLSEGKHSRARREIDSLEEMFEQPKRARVKEKTIRIGPKTLRRPKFDSGQIEQRQQQLYAE